MLTADLIDVRRKDGELVLRPLDAGARAEAARLAEGFLDAARALVGRRREELDAAWGAIEAGAKKPRVAKGLRKLALDACAFEQEAAADPSLTRRGVFARAAEARRAGAFDREGVVGAAARELGISSEQIERALFADLRGEHVLRTAPSATPASLVEAYELGRAQAVLLRAVRVACEVRAASPGPLRALFAKLKFLRLLFTAERLEHGYRVTIDGPFSMFESVTKYGVRLAMLLPALRALDSWALSAEVRWGKQREPLAFRLSSADVAPGGRLEPHLADDVREVLEHLKSTQEEWQVEPAAALLDVPGLGVCVPDLVFRRGGNEVYLEVLGLWSRDAVFRRVELASRDLGCPIVFAASARLRVSTELLGDDVPASLYVYKGKMSPRAVLAHVERAVVRSRRRTPLPPPADESTE